MNACHLQLSRNLTRDFPLIKLRTFAYQRLYVTVLFTSYLCKLSHSANYLQHCRWHGNQLLRRFSYLGPAFKCCIILNHSCGCLLSQCDWRLKGSIHILIDHLKFDNVVWGFIKHTKYKRSKYKMILMTTSTVWMTRSSCKEVTLATSGSVTITLQG